MNVNIKSTAIDRANKGRYNKGVSEQCLLYCNMIDVNIVLIELNYMEVHRMPEVQYKFDLPAFTGRNVPIKEIAKAMGKDAQYVRVGIQQGVLKFGVAIKMEDSNEYNYYCPDKKVWEETGYFRSIPETV